MGLVDGKKEDEDEHPGSGVRRLWMVERLCVNPLLERVDSKIDGLRRASGLPDSQTSTCVPPRNTAVWECPSYTVCGIQNGELTCEGCHLS